MSKKNQYSILSRDATHAGVQLDRVDQLYRLVATGSWTIGEVSSLDLALKKISVSELSSPGLSFEIDLHNIERLDTAGAFLLHRTAAHFEDKGLIPRFFGGTDEHELLLDEVGQHTHSDHPPVEKRHPVLSLISDGLETISHIGQNAIDLSNFLGSTAIALGRIIRHPSRFRILAFIHHLEHIGLRAVPIVSLICFLIGAVIMQQGVIQFAVFSAEPYAINMLAVLGLREVGILLTAIMVAGRSGSAFTAEIGSMKMREEIDAMRTLGIDPIETLVVPRILALIIALPVLTFIGDMMCLVGGGVMANIYLHLESAVYLEELRNALETRHLFAGLIKAPFAAVSIGLVGCLEGFKVKGSAESLGFHVTSAVVKSIFLVIILDAIFAIFLSTIGV